MDRNKNKSNLIEDSASEASNSSSVSSSSRHRHKSLKSKNKGQNRQDNENSEDEEQEDKSEDIDDENDAEDAEGGNDNDDAGNDDDEDEDEEDENEVNEYQKDGFVVSDEEDDDEDEDNESEISSKDDEERLTRKIAKDDDDDRMREIGKSAGEDSDKDNNQKMLKRKRKRLRKVTALDEDDLELIRENRGEDIEYQDDDFKRIKRGGKSGFDKGEEDYGDDSDNVEDRDKDKLGRRKETSEGNLYDNGFDADDFDSDNMDEFIVDEKASERKQSTAFINRKLSRKSRDFEYAEEQNSEFVELFGYEKDDMEGTQINIKEASKYHSEDNDDANDEEKIGRSASKQRKSILSRVDYIELAKNYMTEDDEKIRTMDIPERMHLREMELGFKRDLVNRGEFFLRFNFKEAEKFSVDDIVNSVKQQRLNQGRWIFDRLKELKIERMGLSIYNEICPYSFEDVEKNLLFILYSIQVDMLEPPYLYVYKKDNIGVLNMEDLWEIYDMRYDYALLIQKRDSLLRFIENVMSDDVTDEEKCLYINEIDEVLPDPKLVNNMQYMKYDDDSYLPRKDIVPDDAYVPVASEKKSWKKRLMFDLDASVFNFDLTQLRNLHEYLKFRFGERRINMINNSESLTPDSLQAFKQGNVTKSKRYDDLFGEDESDYDDDTHVVPPDLGIAKLARVTLSSTRLKKNKGARASLILKYPGLDCVLKCLMSVPYFGFCVCSRQEKYDFDPDILEYISSGLYEANPNYAAAKVLSEMSGLKRFNNKVKNVFLLSVNILAREIMLDCNVLKYLRTIYQKRGKITVSNGPKFEQVISDFGNPYIRVIGLKDKPFDYFTEKKLDHENNLLDFRDQFVLIMQGRREGFLTVETNTEEMLKDIEEAFITQLLSKKFLSLYFERKEKRETLVKEDFDVHGKDAWDYYRLEIIKQSLKLYIKPWLQKSMLKELYQRSCDVVAREVGFRMSDRLTCGPIKLPLLSLKKILGDTNAPKLFAQGKSLRILSLYLTNQRYNYELLGVNSSRNNSDLANLTCGVLLDGNGEELLRKQLPSLADMETLLDLVKQLIGLHAPHFVVINDQVGLKSRYFLGELEKLSRERLQTSSWQGHSDDVELENANYVHNPQKILFCFIAKTDVAGAVGQAMYVEHAALSDSHSVSVNEFKALSLGRFALDPFIEISKLYSDTTRFDLQKQGGKIARNSILSVSLHSLQSFVKDELLLKYVDRQLLSHIMVNGVDLNNLLRSGKVAFKTLQFLPGFGARKALALVDDHLKGMMSLNSRIELKQTLAGYKDPYDNEGVEKHRPPAFYDSGYKSIQDVIGNSFATSDRSFQQLLSKLYYHDDIAIPGHIYESCIGFIKISLQEANVVQKLRDLDEDSSGSDKEHDTKEGSNPFDTTRIHPGDYKLASLLCWTLLQSDEPIPKLTEKKFLQSESLDVEDSNEDEIPSGKNTTSQELRLDRDDIEFPLNLLRVIEKVFKACHSSIASIVDTEDENHVERKSELAHNSFYNVGDFVSGVHDIGADTVHEVLNSVDDILKHADLYQFCGDSLAELETNNDDDSEEARDRYDRIKIRKLLFIVEEIRYPFLAKKKPYNLPAGMDLFGLFMPSDVSDMKVGSEITAKVVSFNHNGITVRILNGFQAKLSMNDLTSENFNEYFNEYERNMFSLGQDRLSVEQKVEKFCVEQLGFGEGDLISCWIKLIDKEHFHIKLTRSADESLKLLQFGPTRIVDPYYDIQRLKNLYEKKISADIAKKVKPQEAKRRITHPDFFNFTSSEQSQLNAKLNELKLGEFIFRPSRQSLNSLVLNWKLLPNLFNNITIKEQGKNLENPELAETLIMSERTFDDLDEIIATYINPINNYIKELIDFKEHFRNEGLSEVSAACNNEKRTNPKKVPYFIIPDKKTPGNFLFVFQPNRSVHTVKFAVRPEGYLLDEGVVFNKLAKLVEKFKAQVLEIVKQSNAGYNSRGGSDYRRAPAPQPPNSRPPRYHESSYRDPSYGSQVRSKEPYVSSRGYY